MRQPLGAAVLNIVPGAFCCRHLRGAHATGHFGKEVAWY
jgi:hypothetical protein